MERLTNKREADLQRKSYENRLNQGYPRNIPEERFLRLAAYEDTGLEPEEIETLKTGTCLGCSVPELKEGQALHKEWEEAYQQGRLVVLPCVAQTDIERDGHIYRGDHWSHILTAFREDPTSPSGMRVALIDIEEAERALEGQK